MRQLKPIAGARVLLFDRLVDLHPEADEGQRPFRILDREQLKASVRRELGRLLNTRCSIPLDRLGETERSVVNYGIPDFSSLSAHNADDRALIGSIIAKTIAAFEPRLREVRVDVEPIGDRESAAIRQTQCEHDIFEMDESGPGSEGGLLVFIEALMAVDLFNEPVSFPVLLNSKNGAAEIHDS
jgi:type VI secretion system protein ImpF